MNRRALLIVSLVALFGLRAPLCVFACLENSSPAPIASTEHHSGETPCHGGAPSSPEDAPASDHECDCDSFQVLLTKGETSKAKTTGEVAAPAPLLVSFVVRPAETTPARFWKRQQDLPPPDILLLKSTLLI